MAASLLEKVLGRPSLQSLQGLEIIQLYLQISSRYTLASHIGGVATRLAQNLGLHRHSHRFKFDPLETELRRRLWWCQYSLDAFSSAYHGMPRLIRDQDVDTDLPTRINHDLLSRSHVAFPLPGERSQVDAALSFFKLARIVGDTLENLYTTTRRRGGVAKIKRLQAELDMWEREARLTPDTGIDPTLTNDPGDGDDTVSSEATLETAFLRAALCVATVHIHRPALSFTTAHPQFSLSLRICARASASYINLLAPSDPATSHVISEFHLPISLLVTLLYPNGAHMLWQAGLTLLFARWKGQIPDEEGGDDDGLVRRCVAALRSIHSITDDAGAQIIQCADVLELLRGKTFSAAPAAPWPVTETLQWNVWDWPMASALELANTLDAAPDFFLESEPWP